MITLHTKAIARICEDSFGGRWWWRGSSTRLRAGLSPPGGEYAAPVVPADRRQLLVVETRFAQGGEELWQSGHVAQLGRDRGAVEVGAEGDVLDADPVRHVAGVLGDQGH